MAFDHYEAKRQNWGPPHRVWALKVLVIPWKRRRRVWPTGPTKFPLEEESER